MGKDADKLKKAKSGITRRGFISSVGGGAMAVAAVGGAAVKAEEKVESAADKMIMIRLKINDREHKVPVEPRYTLLYVIREVLGLNGTKNGCERGECGACTVLINGIPRYACMTLAVEAEGREITTLEGLMDGEELGVVQKAFADEDALQCGFCTPGQIMAVEGLLRQNPNPSLEEIRKGVSGNLCRCGAYQHIYRAADRAAEMKRKKGGES